MSTLKLVGIAILISALTLAQANPPEPPGKIQGRVTDKDTGEGIPGVAINIIGTNQGAAATYDGSFVILNVPPGIYSLLAKTIGYNSVQIDSVKVLSYKTTELNFELISESMEVEDIIVAAEA